ncbi:hypothetical protein BJX70DRAFT_374585 [Aspergillus crustosus]
MWIEDLDKKDLPKFLDHRTLDWLFIAWVFGDQATFGPITRTIQLESTDLPDWGPLPIPQVLIDTLSQGRINTINQIIATLHSLFNGFVDGIQKCKIASDERCAYTALGALTKHLIRLNLLMPTPAPPYPGITANKLLGDCLSQIKSPAIHATATEPCGLQSRIWAILGAFKGPDGLQVGAEQFAKFRDTGK